MFYIIAAGLTAFLVTYFAIPSIIKIAFEKNLVDEPGERRSHSKSVPTLGGIGIFAGVIFSATFWIPFNYELYPEHQHIQYVFCAFIVIFLIGAKDDIIPLTPSKKMGGQFLAALILIFKAKLLLNNFYGIFGITEVPYLVAVPLTLFTIIVIINALNLIDGINGLSGTIGCVICSAFGYWFYEVGRLDLAILAASMIGGLIAFLRYNIACEIFMGDTGSLLLGLTAAVLSISFIQVNQNDIGLDQITTAPAVAVGVLIIPLFDTLRVFTLRILKGKSPFNPDRTHVHHILLDLGCSHLQATTLLGTVNLAFVFFVFSCHHLIGTLWLLLSCFALASLLMLLLRFMVKRKEAESNA